MWEAIGRIFGTSKVLDGSMKMIDDAFYTDSEKAEDKMLMQTKKAEQRIRLMEAYAPFKLAQRYIAFGFTFVFLFLMICGILGTMFGIVDVGAVEEAKDFANKMWLGEIVLMIVSFYFGGGLMESASVLRKGSSNQTGQ